MENACKLLQILKYFNNKAKESFNILSDQHSKSEKILTVRSKLYCPKKLNNNQQKDTPSILQQNSKFTEIINIIDQMKDKAYRHHVDSKKEDHEELNPFEDYIECPDISKYFEESLIDFTKLKEKITSVQTDIQAKV